MSARRRGIMVGCALALSTLTSQSDAYMNMADDHQEYLDWAIMGALEDVKSPDGAAFLSSRFGFDVNMLDGSDEAPAIKLFNGAAAPFGRTRAAAPGQIEINRNDLWLAASGDLVWQETIEATIAHETAHWVDLNVNGMFTDGMGGNPPEWGNAYETTLYGFVKNPFVPAQAPPGDPNAPHGRTVGAINSIEFGASASFNVSTGMIVFGDNLQPASLPTVDIASYADGEMLFSSENSDPIALAQIEMSPIRLLPDQGDGLFHFTDLNLRILGGPLEFLNATVHDLVADPNAMTFIGRLADVSFPAGLASRFVSELSTLVGSIWTGPAPLLMHAGNFDVDGSAKFAGAISGVPEPSAISILLLGGLLVVRGSRTSRSA
jgi:hypothetical protein